VNVSDSGNGMMNPSRPQFEALVEEALASLPAEILSHLDNVAITIADWPGACELERAKVACARQLFGLYEGVPLTQRGARYNLVTPDRITLYRGPLQAACHTSAALRDRVCRTVVHEIAHHFGMDEAHIRELGF
jgi:predicted Zn-dependent protease with MMP-like domain